MKPLTLRAPDTCTILLSSCQCADHSSPRKMTATCRDEAKQFQSPFEIGDSQAFREAPEEIRRAIERVSACEEKDERLLRWLQWAAVAPHPLGYVRGAHVNHVESEAWREAEEHLKERAEFHSWGPVRDEMIEREASLLLEEQDTVPPVEFSHLLDFASVAWSSLTLHLIVAYANFPVKVHRIALLQSMSDDLQLPIRLDDLLEGVKERTYPRTETPNGLQRTASEDFGVPNSFLRVPSVFGLSRFASRAMRQQAAAFVCSLDTGGK